MNRPVRVTAFAVMLLLASTTAAQTAERDDIPEKLQVRWEVREGPLTFGNEYRFVLISQHPGDYRLEPLPFDERTENLARVVAETSVTNDDGSVEVRSTIALRALTPDSFTLPAIRRTIIDPTGRSISREADRLSVPVTSVLSASEQSEKGPGPIEHLAAPATLPRPLSQRARDVVLWLGTAFLLWFLRDAIAALWPRLRRSPRLVELAREGLSAIPPDADRRTALEAGSRVLREYFDRRHGTNTSSASTGHALDGLPGDLAETDSARQLEALLERSDAVKFPRSPAPEDLQTWLRDAERFLEVDDQLERGMRRAREVALR